MSEANAGFGNCENGESMERSVLANLNLAPSDTQREILCALPIDSLSNQFFVESGKLMVRSPGPQ